MEIIQVPYPEKDHPYYSWVDLNKRLKVLNKQKFTEESHFYDTLYEQVKSDVLSCKMFRYILSTCVKVDVRGNFDEDSL
jgi:hypothetical protein